MNGATWIYNQGKGRTLLLSLLLGQFLSLTLAMTSFARSFITSTGADAPLTASFFTYLVVALVFGGFFLYRQQRLLVPWYLYALLGLVDVTANYLVNKAYEYTSITSVTLLDCCTIAWAIVLTWLVLRTPYSLWQFFGAAVCVGGVGLVILSDSNTSSGGGSSPLLGDSLVVAGTVFYAMSNVGVEFCGKKKDLLEVLAMLGLFGMLISLSGMVTIERKSIESIEWSPQLILAYAGCTIAGFVFSLLGSFALKMGGSTLMNLSLLTSDMWALVIRMFFYKQQVNWLYYPAYALVSVGILIYSIMQKVPDSTKTLEDENTDPDYMLLEEGADISVTTFAN